MTNYTEDVKISENYRKNYLESIDKTVESLCAEAENRRAEFVLGMKDNIPLYRSKYIEMLGYPMNSLSDSRKPPEVKREFVSSDDVCDIYRLTVNTFEEIKFYGLLFVPHGAVSAPLVICQHGGWGTPELCSDMHGKNSYNNMVRRTVAEGAVVFAPQQLLWNIDKALDTAPAYGLPYNRSDIFRKLRHYGVNLISLEIYNIVRTIDYLAQLDEVDEDRIGMMGLSYGGFYTLYTMAADTRIKVGYSSCFFNDRNRYDYFDWTWYNSANTFHDAEVACLCADRHICIEVGKEDPVFKCETALEEYERLRGYLDYLGLSENLLFNAWDGGHKISMQDNTFGFFMTHLK